MDEVKASPRNELLFSIAQKLREAPAKLRRVRPVLGSLGEFVLGGIPKGLEHYAYGDSPLGPPANAPMVRADRAFDMLEATPIAAVAGGLPGKAAAQLVPARPLLNADATAAQRLAQRIRKADDAVLQGASTDELWKNFGLSPAPGLVHSRMSGKVAPDVYHARWLEELDPENLLQKNFDPTQVGRSSIHQVFNSPELFRQYPHLKDIEVDVIPASKRKKGTEGEFWFTKGPAGRIELPQDSSNPADVLRHELSHGVMHNFGQANASGYGALELSDKTRGSIADMNSYLQLTQDPRMLGSVPMQLEDFIRRPEGHLFNRTGTWDRSSGEAIAEAVRMRANVSPEYRAANPPDMAYPVDVDQLHNDQLTYRAMQTANSEGPVDYKTQSLLKLLRDFGVLPK